jgi:hypothetical protein
LCFSIPLASAIGTHESQRQKIAFEFRLPTEDCRLRTKKRAPTSRGYQTIMKKLSKVFNVMTRNSSLSCTSHRLLHLHVGLMLQSRDSDH